MQEATQAELAAAGLPADYQTLSAINPVNIASEEAATQSLQLKDKILANTAERAAAFLNPDELNRFQALRATAVKNSQNYILMERKLMAPSTQ